MASSYVNDLRLNELGTGDGAGTWGTTTNTNLELIAEGLSFGTEAITTNADTHTSTVADGATDPARSIYIKYTGTLDSACTITIAPNTISRLHFIENGTSGSQNIIISQGSGANVTIPPGDVKVVYLDGAGSGAAVVDAFASLSVVDLKVQDDLTVTDAITASGVITGLTLEATGDTSAGDNAAIGFTSAEGLILTGQGSTSDITVKNDADGTVFTVPTGTDDILFPDNAKILMGAGSDLEIFHDGSNSNISDVGTGQLVLRTDGTQIAINKGSSENMAKFITDGAVELYHDNSKKFETTSTGVDITGGLTATAPCTITVDSNADTLVLKSTDADAVVGPILVLQRDSSSPADNDALGFINFTGDDDTGTQTAFATMAVTALDVSNGAMDGKFELSTIVANGLRSRMMMNDTETVFNDGSIDLDFRIETDAQTNAFFIDAGNEAASMAIPLTITTADNNAQFILKSTDADSDAGPFIDMQRDSGSPADNDFIGKIRFAADDDGGNVTEFAQIQAQILDASNGSEDGTLQIRTTVGGSVGTPRVDFLAGETVFNEGSNDLDFRVESNANANCLFVDAGNDKIGIRTGTPQFGLSFSQGTSDSSRLGWHDSSNNKRASIICSSASDSLSFHTGTSDAERVRILSSGGFVVGGTTVDSYGGVAATNTMYGLVASGAYALGLTQNTTSAGGGRVLGLRNVTDFNNTGNEVITYIGDATNRFLVVSNGNVTNTNNSYGAISDQKLKEQITDASSQWDDIKALTVRKYKMKDEVLAEGDSNAAWKLGVIAQELETAGMAGLVDERIDRDEDGNDAGTTTKQVKYSVLYMKAVKALQEAMTRIETLETKVAALEAS